ncbi:MAG: bis(5'-nucleosyl)-tetraphosphatase (symmetrical) YqeK [Clostridia bacterium]|nr:bis(5'-nucleosyl)-tetraphosphatase (symmetrical) YqeK [Clostridia bacterium]
MLTLQEMDALLRESLSEHRYAHSLGVTETAVKLAKAHGGDTEKCRIAGLLHDCAKGMSTSDMLRAIYRNGIVLYPGEEDFEQLLHAPAGAAVAREIYGVDDEEILSAIRSHTVGGRNMSLTDKIIYVADFIEPGRKSFTGLEDARDLALKDINAAQELCAHLTNEYCHSRGQKVFSI